MSALYDLARERIGELQEQRDSIDAELATLTEIERLAASLNGGGIVPDPVAKTSRPATARPTQPRGAQVADPPSRKPASRSSHKPSSRRAPAVPSSSGTTQGPAPAGGGDLVPRVAEILADAHAPLSRSAIVRQLGLPDTKGTRLSSSLRLVDVALEQLRKDKRARVAGTVRGGGEAWAKATPPEENRASGVKPVEEVALQAAGVTDPPDMPKLDAQIVATLRELGPRKQYELSDDLGELDGDIGRSLGRLCRAELVRSVKHGPGKPTYELTEV